MNDELRRIAELAEVTGGRMPFVFRDGAPAKPALAAAGLSGAEPSCEACTTWPKRARGAVEGVLLRSLYETWLCALYVLVLGDAAIEELQLASHHERRLLARGLTIDLPADPSTKTQRLKIASVKDKLCKPRRTSGENTDAVENGYQWLHRGESALNTHGGLDAIAGYVEEWQGGLRVVARRSDADAPDFRLVTAWARALDLAVALWKEFGWDTADLDRQADTWRGSRPS